MKVNSFSKRLRLTSNREFRKALYKGKRVKSFPLDLRFLKTNLNYSRLGISVAKSAGNAVQRNYLKRTIREWFRTSRKQFSCSFDIVIIIRNKLSKDRVPGITKSLNDIFIQK